MSAQIRTVILAGALIAAPAVAHHGISNWDLNKDVTLTGKLTRIDLINPHAWIHLEVRGQNGKAVSWGCEMRSVNSLRRSGWTREMFVIGSRITINGSPERTKPYQCYLSTIQFADGSQMNRYGQRQLATATPGVTAKARSARLANGLPNLGGDWAAEQRVMSDPRGLLGTLVPLSQTKTLQPGELPAGQRAFPGARGTPESMAKDPVKAAWNRPIPVQLTATGKRAAQSFNPATRDNPRLRCEPTNIVFDWTFDSVVNRIVQTPTRITLQYGHMDLQRMIHLDQTAVPAGTKPSLAGYSIGKFEGDTLVVTTTAFAPGVLNADGRALHGRQLRITERFTLDATGSRLTRQYEAVDPEYFTDAWRGEDVVYPSDVPYAPYACKDPGGAPASASAATRSAAPTRSMPDTAP
jgi:hypothetical protein